MKLNPIYWMMPAVALFGLISTGEVRAHDLADALEYPISDPFTCLLGSPFKANVEYPVTIQDLSQEVGSHLRDSILLDHLPGIRGIAQPSPGRESLGRHGRAPDQDCTSLGPGEMDAVVQVVGPRSGTRDLGELLARSALRPAQPRSATSCWRHSICITSAVGSAGIMNRGSRLQHGRGSHGQVEGGERSQQIIAPAAEGSRVRRPREGRQAAGLHIGATHGWTPNANQPGRTPSHPSTRGVPDTADLLRRLSFAGCSRAGGLPETGLFVRHPTPADIHVVRHRPVDHLGCIIASGTILEWWARPSMSLVTNTPRRT